MAHRRHNRNQNGNLATATTRDVHDMKRQRCQRRRLCTSSRNFIRPAAGKHYSELTFNRQPLPPSHYRRHGSKSDEDAGPLLGTKGSITETALQEIAAARSWGNWQAYFALYGPKPFVESSWDFIKASFAKVPGAKCEGKLFISAEGQLVQTADLPVEDIPHSGTPHLKNLALMDYRGKGSGHICFSPIIPPSGQELYD